MPDEDNERFESNSQLHKNRQISRIVYSLPSPFMGGHSKWNIMEDEGLEKFPPFFAMVPEVIGGLLENEAKAVFDKTPMWMFGSKPEFRKS